MQRTGPGPNQATRFESRASASSQPTPGGGVDASGQVGKKKLSSKKLISGAAKTLVAANQIYLMGESIAPGNKVGLTFRNFTDKMSGPTKELFDTLNVDKEDVVVVLDEHFHLPPSHRPEASARKAAKAIRLAGDHAVVAVSTGLDKASGQIHKASPGLKRAVKKHGRDVVVLVDKGLKEPVVISGITKLAKSRGIPHSEALLKVASMGLSKLLEKMPKDGGQPVVFGHEGPEVSEMDAQELEDESTGEALEEADFMGHVGESDQEGFEDVDDEGVKDDDKCTVA